MPQTNIHTKINNRVSERVICRIIKIPQAVNAKENLIGYGLFIPYT
jgi:hypothetical protein